MVQEITGLPVPGPSSFPAASEAAAVAAHNWTPAPACVFSILDLGHVRFRSTFMLKCFLKAKQYVETSAFALFSLPSFTDLWSRETNTVDVLAVQLPF